LFSPGQVIRLVWGANHDRQRFATPTSVSGSVVVIGNYSGGTPLPAQGTTISIGPGSFFDYPNGSYQEKDLDVAATLIKKGNRYVNDNSFDSLDGDALPSSLFRTGKPIWFGTLTWPPYDPVTPRTPNVTDIPAGYRYVHGVDPPMPAPTPGVTLESQPINLPSHDGPSATPESQRIDLPPHDGASATPEPQQKFQKKWTKNKKAKKQTGTKTKKNSANETSETPGPSQP
jgi:hypothetical protein